MKTADQMISFSLAVAAAIGAQILIAEQVMTKRQAAAAALCGILTAWMGTWPIVERYALSDSYIPLVAGMLALTGRQLLAMAFKRVPELLGAFLTGVTSHAISKTNAAVDALVVKSTTVIASKTTVEPATVQVEEEPRDGNA